MKSLNLIILNKRITSTISIRSLVDYHLAALLQQRLHANSWERPACIQQCYRLWYAAAAAARCLNICAVLVRD